MRPRLPSLPSPFSALALVLLITGAGLMVASWDVERSRTSGAVVVPARATVAATPAATLRNDPTAVALYRRAQAAARSTAYDGVKTVTRTDGSVTRTAVLKVSHEPSVGMVVEADGADGRAAGEMFTRTSSSATSGDDELALRALLRSYRLRDAGDSAAAGRPASLVEVVRTDGSVAARLWVDDQTGLLLRREILDGTGAVVESSAFVKVEVGEPDLRHLPPVAPSPWAVVPAADLDALRAQQWPLPESLDGGFVLAEVRRDDSAPQGEVLQLAYTDGLADLSVFVQRGALDSGALGDAFEPVDLDGGQVWVRRDGVPLVVWQSGDHVVTATSDTAAAPLAEVVAVLPADPAPSDGVGARVERGVQRVGSWLNPLG